MTFRLWRCFFSSGPATPCKSSFCEGFSAAEHVRSPAEESFSTKENPTVTVSPPAGEDASEDIPEEIKFSNGTECKEAADPKKDFISFEGIQSPAKRSEPVLKPDSTSEHSNFDGNTLEVNENETREEAFAFRNMVAENSKEDENLVPNGLGKPLQSGLEKGEKGFVSEDPPISEILPVEESPAVAWKTSENPESEVIDSSGRKVGSVAAPGREMKVQGGEILESANAQTGKAANQLASQELEVDEGKERDVAELSVLRLTTAFVVTDGGRVDSGNHSGVSEGGSSSGGKAMEEEGTTPGAGNVSDATEPVEGGASSEEEARARAAEENKTGGENGVVKKIAEEKARAMDAVNVMTDAIPVASSSPSLEKWDSFDIIGDLVDQVGLNREMF